MKSKNPQAYGPITNEHGSDSQIPGLRQSRLRFLGLLLSWIGVLTTIVAAEPLTISDLSTLIVSGYTTEQIMSTVQKKGLASKLDKEALSKLRQTGGSPDLILALNAFGGAIKESPQTFTNTLGMKFVPVPGTEILMCIHDTRIKDFQAFWDQEGKANRDNKWGSERPRELSLNHVDEANYPAVMVSWSEAKQFCAWLSTKEGKAYRLPTDHEWSCAVGIGDREDPKASPREKHIENPDKRYPGMSERITSKRDKKWIEEAKKPDDNPKAVLGVFPWGAQWPPPSGVGNFSDAMRWSNYLKVRSRNRGDTLVNDKDPSSIGRVYFDVSAFFDDVKIIEGYKDEFAATSPVMSFKPNQFGLYDMAGNVWQWCEDSFHPNSPEYRVLRGGAWTSFARKELQSAYRRWEGIETPLENYVHRGADIGFRIVVK